MPKTTHKNAGVTVITAVMRRNAVIIPIIILVTIAINGQLILQLQLYIELFTSCYSICS